MNLIICTSPLQVLIAERIIELYPEEQFYGVMFTQTQNDKFIHYTQRLRKACKGKLLHIQASYEPWGNRWTTLKLIYQAIKAKRVTKIFFASLDLNEIGIFIRFNPQAELISFDDGTINIVPNALDIFHEFQTTSRQGGLNRLLNLPSVDNILKRITRHYTIYDAPNICPNAVKIDLFRTLEQVQTQSGHPTGSTRILLGQVLWTEDPKRNQLLDQYVVQQYGITQYIPHPKVEVQTLEGATVIQSPYIFEDYLTQAIEADPSSKFIIYTYCSTAALNAIGHPSVEVIAIRPQSCPNWLLPTYLLFEKMGCKIIDLDDW